MVKTFTSVKWHLAHWQPHIERAAFPFRPVLGPDGAVVQLDDALANGQAQAETVDFSCEPCIHAMKTVEDPLKVLGRYPYTSIAHTDLQHLSRELRRWLFGGLAVI